MIFELTPDISRRRPINPLVLSYLDLRKAVGIIGCALPVLLIVGRWPAKGFGFEPTISDYYYTNMGDVFVGCMCAIGVFLMSARGYDTKDMIAGRLGFLFAIGVAFFPTTDKSGKFHELPFVSTLHITSAALLFVTLAYFCLFLFTKTSGTRMTSRKRTRNKVYIACGIAILSCIVLIFVCRVTNLLES